MRKLLLAIPLLLLAVPANAADALSTTIQKADDAFSAAFNKGDGAAVAQLYTEQATLLPAGADIIKGRAAIQKYWQGAMQSGLKNAALTVVSVEAYGRTTAREIGRFSFDAPGAGGQPAKVEGKYLVVWKKQGGKWLLDADIWNMNK